MIDTRRVDQLRADQKLSPQSNSSSRHWALKLDQPQDLAGGIQLGESLMGQITSAADTNVSLVMEMQFLWFFITAPSQEFLFLFIVVPFPSLWLGCVFWKTSDFCWHFCTYIFFSSNASCHWRGFILWLIKLENIALNPHLSVIFIHNIFQSVCFSSVFWKQWFWVCRQVS